MARELSAIRLAKTKATSRATVEKTFGPETLDLLDFVPNISPRWDRPDHLAPVADAFSKSCTEEVNILLSCPPQHGKTELILHGIAWRLKRDPTLQIFYVSYNDVVAKTKSRLLRDYARKAGVELREDAQAVGEWITPQGGGVVVGGLAGFTSRPCQLLVVDDPYSGREDAESPAYREKVLEFYRSTLKVRVHPGGSKIIVHTRWHQDDLIGRLTKEEPGKWQIINLPAVNDNGEALWPHRRPLSYLEEFKADEFNWWSLWMGAPRPRGTEVFGSPTYYDIAPSEYQLTVGVDLAYTEKTRADYSVAVVCKHIFRERKLEDGKKKIDKISYVVDVVRDQLRAEDFAIKLQQLTKLYPTAKFHSYVSTTEKGTTGLLNSLGGVPIWGHRATMDKFLRAQPAAAAWNRGHILVPRRAEWLHDFIEEIGTFTGVKDRHDDQVDALASAFDSARVITKKAPQAPPLNPRGSFEDRELPEPSMKAGT